MSKCSIILFVILMWFSGWGKTSRDDLETVSKQISIRKIIQSYLTICDNLRWTQTNHKFQTQCWKVIPELMAIRYHDFVQTILIQSAVTSTRLADLKIWQKHHQVLFQYRSALDAVSIDQQLQFFKSKTTYNVDYPTILCSDREVEAKIHRFFQDYSGVFRVSEQRMCGKVTYEGISIGLPLVYNLHSSQLQLYFEHHLLTAYLQIPVLLVFTRDDKYPDCTHTERMVEWSGMWVNHGKKSYAVRVFNTVTYDQVDMRFNEHGILKEIYLQSEYYWCDFRANNIDNKHTNELSIKSFGTTLGTIPKYTKVYAFYYAGY